MLHVAVWSLSFVPIALFGLFLPGRSCVPAAGPITGSRSAEWSIFHQAFADAEVISVGLRLADWHAFGHQARSAESAWPVAVAISPSRVGLERHGVGHAVTLGSQGCRPRSILSRASSVFFLDVGSWYCCPLLGVIAV
jgi:hypothetical protein